MKIADCSIDQERSSKGTILVLQEFLATYYLRYLIHQGLVAQEGILVLLQGHCVESQF